MWDTGSSEQASCSAFLEKKVPPYLKSENYSSDLMCFMGPSTQCWALLRVQTVWHANETSIIVLLNDIIIGFFSLAVTTSPPVWSLKFGLVGIVQIGGNSKVISSTICLDISDYILRILHECLNVEIISFKVAVFKAQVSVFVVLQSYKNHDCDSIWQLWGK